MVDASVRNISTGDSIDDRCFYSYIVVENMLSSVIVFSLLMHVLLNRLVYATKLTKKRDRVALLMYFALTWSSLKSEKSIIEIAFLLRNSVHICLFDQA